MTTEEFIRNMKERAAYYPKEAERCRRESRDLSNQGFIVGTMCAVCAVAMFTASAMLGLIFGAIALACLVAAICVRRSGEKFAKQWMKLREEALRNAKEAE